MADLDLARVKRNVSKMVGMDAPEADIDAYIAEEGTTIDAVKAFRLDAASAPAGIPADDPRREFIRAAKERVASGAPRPDVELSEAAKVVPEAPQDRYDPGALSTSTMAGGDALMFGFGDEIQSALAAPIEMGIGAFTGEDAGKSMGQRVMDGYNRGLRKREDLMEYAAGRHPLASGIGTVAGSVAAGAGLAKAGLSAGANAAARGSGLARVAGGSAVDGAAMGALTGAGTGSGTEGRINGAVSGAIAGGVLGGAVPLAVTGLGAAAKPFIAPIAARVAPERYANQALGAALRRADMTPDAVAKQLEDAALDGQGVFTVADALGNAGQRMLSTVTRTPNDARQTAVEQLLGRQAGQGRRVSNALAEGFDAPDTAIQRTASLTTARDDAADVGYSAARSGATSVDVSPAIAAIDDVIQPGKMGSAMRSQSNIADDSVEGVLSRARSLMTDGKSNLSDFNGVLRVKMDIDDMIGKATRAGAGNQARNLMKVKTQLDAALSKASPAYAGARDAFSAGSRAIDAVEVGAQAARRGRSEDVRAVFDNLSDVEKAGFRVGYANEMIEKTQGAAVGVNKVRPLMTDATAAEFPTIAAPGRGDQLARRIEREQRMFETQNQALGGSRTADNLADMEDMAGFDPAMISRLLNRDFIGAGLAAVTKAFNEAKGLPPRVIEQVGRALMTTDPVAAKRLLTIANTKALSDAGRKRAAVTVLRSIAATSAGQSSAP